jgi:hypothetical protein
MEPHSVTRWRRAGDNVGVGSIPCPSQLIIQPAMMGTPVMIVTKVAISFSQEGNTAATQSRCRGGFWESATRTLFSV